MDDKITVSTFQLFEMFPDQESARKYLESRLVRRAKKILQKKLANKKARS